MRYIRKGRAPAALRDWARANSSLPGARYGSHGFPKSAVKAALLKEQGWICAYTMIRVEESSSHIEHLKPQSVSESEGRLNETFNYQNIVACYPAAPAPADAKVTFGAIQRGSAWDEQKFITPLNANCDRRLQYRADGHVRPRRQKDSAAAWMIGVLKLDDRKLVEMRRAAIDGWGLSLASADAVSRASAKRIAYSVTLPDRTGLLEPFCIAIRDAALGHVDALERAAARRKHITRGKRGR